MADASEFFEDDLAILQEFVEESNESLDSIESQFVALESDPSDQELVNSIFRPIHSIKGNSAFLGLLNVRVLAHEMESLLDGIRKNTLEPTEDVVSSLLAGVDELKAMLARIQSQEDEVLDKGDFDALVKRIVALKPSQKDAAAAPAQQPAPEKKAAPKDKPAAKPAKPAATPAKSSRSIRVQESQLDGVHTLVGELDGVRGKLNGVAEKIGEDPEAAKTDLGELCENFDEILQEIDKQFETMRKVPMRELLQRVPRIARETCAATGKPVKINIKGEGIMVAKSLVDGLEDPLMHMVRNAIDHGVESPQERRKVSKSEQGNLWVEASETDDEVILRVADDGKGIDFKGLLVKAMQLKLVSNARSLTPKDITNLIFLPGLSGAKKVSDLSGRGVGMDVVKHNVEELGGSIDVGSKSGQGTEMLMRFPK